MSALSIDDQINAIFESGDENAMREWCKDEHPAVVAERLAGRSATDIWRALHMLPVALRAAIFAHFSLDRQVELATGENRSAMARLLEEMDSDDRAELVRELDEQVSAELLPLVARAEREDIRRLVSYEDGTAASVMNTDYAVLRPDTLVGQALEQIRHQAPSKETVYYIYVVDDRHRLIGFVSLRKLILSRSSERISDIMQEELISVNVDDDQEEVARCIEKYDLIAVPVVTSEKVLVGIVTHDDALDILRQEQQEDVEKLMAIAGAHTAREYMTTSSMRHFRNRAVWILPLAVFGLISGIIIQRHEELLQTFAILAIFIPMLADTGGNTGSQSATLVVRALALQEIGPRDFLRVMFKEARVALMLGVVLAFVAFGRVLFFGAGATLPPGTTVWRVGIAVSVALGLQVVTSTVFGALLPLIASRLKVDPALVASPALTTVVDISGVFIFFTTTQMMLG